MQHKSEGGTIDISESSWLFEQVPESVIEDTVASIPILSNNREWCASLFGPPFRAVGGEEEMQHKTFDIF